MERQVWLLILGLLLALSSCRRSTPSSLTDEQKEELTSLVKKQSGSEALSLLLDSFTQHRNLAGQVLVCEALGKYYREQSSFVDAIQLHERGLLAAEQLRDTLAMAQALNNIGTNYRRLGMLADASDHHFKALALIEQSPMKNAVAKKTRVVSLNGIGNIYLSLRNLDEAESTFRTALAGEKELGSDLGQAINYANIGAIFEDRAQYDSATVYYRQSLDHNRLARSGLGISLCYNHLGRIEEKKGDLDGALDHYKAAYDIMDGDDDRWHWLESCLSMARVYMDQKQFDKAETYLLRAKATATEINSLEHLSEVYRIAYKWYEEKGDCRRALDSFIRSQALRDSVASKENIAYLQNQRVNYEKEKSMREINVVKKNFEDEQRLKRIILAVSVLILTIVAFALIFLWYALRMRLQAYRVLRQMERVRMTFFTNITHEFRTPLTVILGLVEQMQQKQMAGGEEQSRYLDAIQRQGNSLLELVNQLLDMSKLMAKADRKHWYRGNIIAYIRMMLESYRDYAASSRISILFQPEQSELEIDFVPEYFEKILRNLLSNALKFTEADGTIVVRTRVVKKRFELVVADNGRGISEEDLPHIFDTFYQGANSEGKKGTGLGLPFVKQMVESMEGEITAANQRPHGMIFTLTIPMERPEEQPIPWTYAEAQKQAAYVEPTSFAEEPMPDGEATDPDAFPSVLIVEDSPDISLYISSLLKEKYTLFFAANGKDGFEKAKQCMPDLIITDLMMPGMDGYALCDEIRREEVTNHIPIIIVTAKSEPEDRIRSVKKGADAYLMKPFHAEELLANIERLLEQRRMLRKKYGAALREGTEASIKLTIGERNFMNKLTRMVHAHIEEKTLNADFLADHLCMSRTQLDRKVRAIAGYTTTGFILQLRMEKAKRLLASTEQAVGDIAMTCGFEDTSYFTRVFKQANKMTPSQYRKTPDSDKQSLM